MALYGKLDNAGSKPKWLSAADKAKAFFVSTEEAQLATNKAKGISGAGWYLLNTKVTSDGQTRELAECLVALSVANATAGDAADDTKVADVEFAFTTQPVAASVTAPAAASFSVVVSVPSGATYQWQSKTGNAAFANVANAGVFSGATTATLAISNSTGLNGVMYRCVVTNSGATAQITSKGAKLTVAA
jgi:hypothetical protein